MIAMELLGWSVSTCVRNDKNQSVLREDVMPVVTRFSQ
jgi:hypothetical protein